MKDDQNTQDNAALTDDQLESAAGGAIGEDTGGDGIIDGGCFPDPIDDFLKVPGM